jgi:predicted lipoprotein with Yx(FWY)xxD motif
VTKSLPTIALPALAVTLALAVAGCGSSNSSESSSSGGTYGSGNGTGSEKTTSPASNEAGSGTATFVSVGSAADVGQVLVDSKGMTLYYFQKDKKGSGKSACSGACASAWPPLTTTGKPQPSNGSSASMLGTIERSDGTTQVTYAGWPLYTFVEDKKPGEDNGTDSKAFGASWYPLHPNGEKAGH